MKLKTLTTNWPRKTIQWGIIAFIFILAFLPDITKINTPDFEAYCPFGGLQALGSYLLNQSLSCTMTSTQIVMGVLLFGGIIVFSKLFCSFICPIGTLSELLGKFGDKLKIRITITGWADKIFRSLKYVLLFITVYFTFQSNELFCKKFDPYFALASGFNTDVNLSYAIIAIGITILGSVFIRLFWCKYLCPLGAISNLFKFSVFFVSILVMYLALMRFGIQISYVWPLAIACVGAYLLEVWDKKSKIFPLAKISRDSNSCIDCKKCDETCHQGLKIASVPKVQDMDCNLCGDCLLVCPVKNTLTLNKKKRLKRLPLAATILLAVLGIGMGNVWEVPTIDQKWYDADVMESASIYTQSGLKNIKCYGSSVAFANKMREVDGIYGVATFVKHNKIKLYYDSDILNQEKIQKVLFVPQKRIINPVKKDLDSVQVVILKLENFFDNLDIGYLQHLLKQKTNALGVASAFDCPVIVKIYLPSQPLDAQKLISIIESKTLTYETQNGPVTVELKYKVATKPQIQKITVHNYLRSMFIPFKRSFNYRESYSDSVLKTYSLNLGINRAFRNRFSYLASHLSNDVGIVEFQTKLDSAYHEIAQISYIDSVTTTNNIKKALLSDTLLITYSNGTRKKVLNMFDFKTQIQNLQHVKK